MNYTPINKGQFTLETPERSALFEKNRGFGNEEAYRENRRQWEDYPKRQFVADYPLHVDVELASVCNLKCPMCYTITPEFKSKVNATLMDFALYTKIIDECAAGGVYSVRLSLRGESFLHKRIVDCIAYAKKKGIKEVSTLTNGLRLDEKLFKEVMELGMDWITISFDGLGATYEKIRHPAKFDRAVEKIVNYAKIKREAGRVKPLIKVQAVLPSIIEGPKAFYDTFAPITDMVSANPLIDYLMNDDSTKIYYHADFTCPQLYQRLVIGADGLVMMCSNDEENLHVVGDARTKTIHEMWHGPELTKARASHARHCGTKDYAACAKCYLPRRTEDAVVMIGERSVIAENYIGRSQVIGT
ncbi:MAG: SPASM domain-containing protein [Elusimicrobia bacterium]|nr:SPASM domain-containing protein [Elusimicrobiota bacterium]